MAKIKFNYVFLSEPDSKHMCGAGPASGLPIVCEQLYILVQLSVPLSSALSRETMCLNNMVFNFLYF